MCSQHAHSDKHTRPQLSKAYRRQRGLALVETTIVLPVLFLLAFSIVETSYLFYSYNTMLHVSRETARNVAVRNYTEAEAETFAQTKLNQLTSATFSVVVTTPDPSDPTDNEVVTNISAPVSDLLIAGDPFGLFGEFNLQAVVTMREE